MGHIQRSGNSSPGEGGTFDKVRRQLVARLQHTGRDHDDTRLVSDAGQRVQGMNSAPDR
jgi:hypothetical protein